MVQEGEALADGRHGMAASSVQGERRRSKLGAGWWELMRRGHGVSEAGRLGISQSGSVGQE